jgi:hypothetical protein
MVKIGRMMGFLPRKDAGHPRSFFEPKLGLRLVAEDPYALVLESNGTTVPR